jgi:hypothetical protein
LMQPPGFYAEFQGKCLRGKTTSLLEKIANGFWG